MPIHVPKEKQNTLLPKILEVSLGLFVQHGIDGTTTKAIAMGAGVSEGALYRHFPSKEALAQFLFESVLETLTREMQQVVNASPRGTMKDKLRAVINFTYNHYEKEPALLQYLLAMEHHALGAYPDDKPNPRHVFEELVKMGQRTGEVDPAMDMHIAAALIIGLVERPTRLRRYGTIGPLPALIDEMTDRCLMAVAKRGATAARA